MYRLPVVPIPSTTSQLHNHAMKLKLAKNSKIGVLLELSSHELCSREELQTLVQNEKFIVFLYQNQYFSLNDVVTEPVCGVGHH